MKMTKRFLALFLAVLMAFGSFPSAVIAAGEDQIAPEAEQTAPAPEQAPAEPAPAEPAPAEPAPAEPVSAPAEPAPEVQPEAPAEPAPEQQPEAPAEPAPEQQPEAQPPVEEPAPEQNEYVDEYPSTPSSYTVTWKMTVGGGALFPDIEDVYAPGALLVPPEEAAQYEAQGYEFTYYLDEYRTQTIDFDVDFIAVNADMTVWADAVLPTPAPAPVEPEQVPAEPAEVPAEPAEVPAEPAEVPAEPAEVPAEPAEVPTETEQVPAETEAQQPEAGLPGFELPGIEVPANVPETEIVAPEAQADANTNADNGIETIANDETVTIYLYMKLTGPNANKFMQDYNNGSGYITVGKITIPRSEVKNMPAAPTGFIWDTDARDTYGARAYVNSHKGDIDYYAGSKEIWSNPGFDKDGIDWTEGQLRKCNSANDYSGVGDCWHLDGTYDIKSTAKVTVNYLDENGDSIHGPYTKEFSYGSDYNVESVIPEEITTADGREFVKDSVDGQTSGTIAGRDVTVNVHYKQKTYTVTYSWSGLPDVEPAYGDKPFPQLPATVTGLHKGDSFVADSTYTDASTWCEYDQYGNLLNTYRFSGWTPSAQQVEGDLEVTGTWVLSDTDKIDPNTYKHQVTYSVSGETPVGYTAPGAETYTKGQGYTIAEVPATEYTYDEYDNVTGTYTFDGWKDAEGNIVSGEQTMGGANVEYKGTWTYTARDTSEYNFNVSYSVTGNAPADYKAPETKTYTKGQTVDVDAAYDGPIVENENGSVTVWTFDGWTTGDANVANGSFVMPGKDVAFTGEWSKSQFTVSVALDGWTYDGTAHEPEANVTPEWPDANGPVFTYYQVKGGERTKLDAAPFQAGDYIVVASWTIDGDTVTAEAAYTIGKAELKFGGVKVAAYDNGNPITVEFTTGDLDVYEAAETAYLKQLGMTIPKHYQQYLQKDDSLTLHSVMKGTGVESEAYSYRQSWDNGFFDPDEANTPVGGMHITHTMPDGTSVDVTDSYEIEAFLMLVVVDPALSQADLIYGEQPAPKASVEDELLFDHYGTPTLTYAVKDEDGNVGEFTSELPKYAGAYQVKASWMGDTYLPKLEKTVDFIISKRPITVTVEPDAGLDLYVNDNGTVDVHPGVIGGYGLVDGHSVTLDPTTGTVDTTAAGEKKVEWTGEAKITDGEGKDVTDNYKIDYEYGSATVKPLYTVTYHDGDKTLSSEQVKVNHTAEGYTPVKEHYNFKGWAKEKGGEVAYKPDDQIVVTENMDLYAVWTYMQTFYGIVDGLTVEQVQRDTVKLSCNIKLADGALVKFNKTDADVVIKATENPSITRIEWTKELPETVIGTDPAIVMSDFSFGVFNYNKDSNIWKSLQYAGSSMPAPDEAEVGLVYARARGSTTYQKAEGGTIKVDLPALDSANYLGLSDGQASLTEYWRLCEGPVGATAVADPGYVFKGWYKYFSSGAGAQVTTNETLTQSNMKYNSKVTDIIDGNQQFIPVFEKVTATMTVAGGSWEYDYTTHYPTVTFDQKDVAAFYKVMYSADGTTWSEKPIGIMHVADGPKTVHVKAVDTRDDTQLPEQEVTLTVKPHPVTVKSSDALEEVYSGYPIGNASKFAKGYGVDVFYEAQNSNGYGTFIGSTCDGEINAGTYEGHYTFTLNWGQPNLASQDPIYKSDYDVTCLYGTLIIKQLKIHIGTNTTKTVPYNGEVQVFELSEANITKPATVGMGGNQVTYANGYSAKIASTDTLSADFRGKGPGVYNTLNWKIVNKETGEDMSGNYVVTYEGGLTIDPVIDVTVENGTAEPSENPIQVAYGEDQTITFTAEDNYELESVTVDGEAANLAADGSYTFPDVTANHSIRVVYKEMIRSVAVEYYYDGELGNAPSDAPTELTGQVGTTVSVEPAGEVSFSYGTGYNRVSNEYELDKDAGDTYKVVVKEDGSAVITVHYKRIYATSTGSVNIQGLPRELLPMDAVFSCTLRWKEVNARGTGTVTKTKTVQYTFAELLELCGEPVSDGENSYHFDVPLTVPMGSSGVVTQNSSSVTNYDVQGYSEKRSAWLSSDSNKIDQVDDLGMLVTITYNYLGEHTVTIHYVDKVSGEVLADPFVSDPIGGEKSYDFTDKIPETIVKDGVTYQLFDSTYTRISKAKGTMADKDIEVTAYYGTDSNGDGINDAAQVFVTYNVVNGAWNDKTREQVSEVITVYTYSAETGKWTSASSADCKAKMVPAVGSEPDVGFMAGGWDKNPNTTYSYATAFGKSFEYTYTYAEDPNFIPTASVTVPDTTYGDSYEPTAATPTGPHGSEYEVSFRYYAANEDGEKGEELSGKPVNAGSYIVEATWTAEGRPVVTAEASFTIAKKSVIVKADDKSKVYGENDPALTFTMPDGALAYEDTADDLGVKLTRESGEDVNEYAITGTANSSNYAVTVEEGTFTIMAADATELFIVSDAPTDYMYDGTEHKWVPEVHDGEKLLAENTDYTVTYQRKGEATDDFVNANDPKSTNDKQITVTIEGIGNYSGKITRTYKIAQRPIYLYTDNKENPFIYDGIEHRLTATKTNLESLTEDPVSGRFDGVDYKELVVGDHVTYVNEGAVYIAGTNRTNGQYISWVNAFPDGYDIYTEKTVPLITIVNAEDKDVSRNYKGRIAMRLYIDPRPVTLTSQNLTKPYDGTPLTNGGAEVTVSGNYGGFVGDDGVESYSFSGSRTLPGGKGERENRFTYTLKSGTTADPDGGNYTITTVYGDLVVTDRTEKYEITVKANSDTVTYDGQNHSVSGFESLAFEAANGLTYTVEGLEASASGTDAGEYPAIVTGTAVVKDAAGHDVTAQFTVHTEDGKLTINKKAATVTSASASKVYDGTALTAPEVTGEAFVEGEGVHGTATGSQTVVGDSKNPFTYEANEGTNLDNYTITPVEGTLTVTDRETPYEITVKAKSDTVTYDGTEQSVSGFESLDIEAANGLTYTVEGLTASASGTNADTYPVAVNGTAVVKDAAGNDVTAQFEVHTEDGQLTINKRAATVTSASASKVYDGTALTAPEVTYDGFVEGEGVHGTATGSQLIVGDSKNPFTYEANEGTNLNNYTITETEGTLTVTNRGQDAEHPLYAISVQPNGGNATYDGTEHSVSGFESLTFEVEGNTYTVEGLTASASGTNADTYPVAVNGTAVVKDAAGNDVTAQFEVSVGSASLVIARANATVTADPAGKTFGAVEPDLTATVSGLFGDDSIDYSVARQAGENVGTYTITPSGAAVQGNYNVSYQTSIFTITAKGYDPSDPANGITVTAPEDTVYNGQAQEQKPVIRDGETVLVEGTDYTLSYEGNVNAGTASVTVTFTGNYSGSASTSFEIARATATVTTGSGTRVYNGAALTSAGSIAGLVNGETAVVNTTSITDAGTVANAYTIDWGSTNASNYNVVDGTIGSLTVTARPVTLTSGGGTKAYDGTPLTNFTVAVGGLGFVAGQGAAYTFTGSQTVVGSSANTFGYTLTGGAQARNYAITTANGTLTVTPAPAAAMAVNTPVNYLYTGTAHQWAPTVTGIGGAVLTAGADYTVAYDTADFTNAGAVTVTVTGIGNYSGTVTRTYQINPRLVIMTSGSAARAYDGTPLTDNTVAIGGNGFVAGEGAAYTFTGSQTAAGTSANTFGYTLTGGAQARNYTITTTNGTLTVTPAPAAAMAVNTPTNFLYTGTAHQWAPTVTGIGGAVLTAGTDYTVAYSTGNFTDVGAVTVTVTGIGNYSGTVTRTYQINPRLVIMTSDSATKTFDGTALRARNVTEGGNGFAAGEGATYNVYGQRTPAGTAQNIFNYTLNAGTDADNYTIIQNYGTLTVTAAPNVPAVTQPDDGNGPTDIDEDETPLGGQPADEADEGDDAADADEEEPVQIEEDETPLAQAPEASPDYTLSEETIITEDETPLGAAPQMTVQECCILHFLLMLAALGVSIYYTHDRKKRQEREFEVRSEL